MHKKGVLRSAYESVDSSIIICFYAYLQIWCALHPSQVTQAPYIILLGANGGVLVKTVIRKICENILFMQKENFATDPWRSGDKKRHGKFKDPESKVAEKLAHHRP